MAHYYAIRVEEGRTNLESVPIMGVDLTEGVRYVGISKTEYICIRNSKYGDTAHWQSSAKKLIGSRKTQFVPNFNFQ